METTAFPFSFRLIRNVTKLVLTGMLTFLLWSPIGLSNPLNGYYTINATLPSSAANFQSIKEFADSLNLNGVSGHVVADIIAGTGPYLGQVVFNHPAGAGPNATITLNGGGESASALTTTTDRHVIRLTDCSYFTILNLNILWDPGSTGGFYGIHLYHSAHDITLSNCNVSMSTSTSTLYGGLVASGSTTSILEAGIFHNISFYGNTLSGGGYGVSLFGVDTSLATNVVIDGNHFYNQHSNSIYLRETNGAIISNNNFDKYSPQVTSMNMIQLAQALNVNAQVFNNDIQLTQTSNGTMKIRGIYLFNGTGHQVYNNVIHNINLVSGDFTGIEVRSSNTSPEICFNTISIDNPNTTSGELFGIREELSNTNSILRNNIISITQPTTDNKSGLVLGTTSNLATALNSNYNDIYVPGGNTAQKGYLTTITYYTLLSNWQTASGQDANSTATDPLFYTPTLSIPSNMLIDNLGINIPWVTVDILGITRGAPPDLGAYEFSPVAPAMPDTIFGDSTVCANTQGAVFSVNPVMYAATYHWTVTGATLASGQGTTSITVDLGNTNALIEVYASNSMGNSSVKSLNINILPVPTVSLSLPIDTLCHMDPPILLSGGTPPNGTYSGTGVSSNSFDPPAVGPGVYPITYTFTNLPGCQASALDTIIVVICVGISQQDPEGSLLVYPNPATTSWTLDLKTLKMPCELILTDATGRILKEATLREPCFTLDCSDLARGTYYLSIKDANHRQHRQKLIAP